VAHVCNPSDSGGRDQEDLGSKPVQANSSIAPISKTPIKRKKKKRGDGGQLVEWLKVWVLSLSPRTTKKKKKKSPTQTKKTVVLNTDSFPVMTWIQGTPKTTMPLPQGALEQSDFVLCLCSHISLKLVGRLRKPTLKNKSAFMEVYGDKYLLQGKQEASNRLGGALLLGSRHSAGCV
jgi:hypothetical protein